MGGINLYGYVGNNPVGFTDPFGLCIWDGCIVEAMAIGAVAFGGVRLAYNAIAGRPLTEHVARDIVVGSTAGLAGAGVTAAAGAAGATTVATTAAGSTPGMVRAFQRQLETFGRGFVERSIRTLQTRLSEHLQKVDQIRACGGNPGSVLRETRNFRAQIEAAKSVLEDGP